MRLAGLLFAALALAAPGSRAQTVAPADPQLEQLLARAAVDSPVLAQARARLEAAEARVDAARASSRPVLALQERVLTTTDPPSAFMSILQQGRLTPAIQAGLNDPPRTDDWATSIGLRWLAFDGGRRKALRESAEAERSRHALLESAALRDVRLAVTLAWLDLARSRARVGLWQDSVALLDGHSGIARARFEEGAALRSEPLAIEVLRDEARESLLASERDVLIARSRLALAVGCAVAELGEDPVLLSTLADPGDAESLVGRARSSHPLSLAATQSIAATAAAERRAARLRHPSLGLDLRQEWHGDDESPGFENSAWSAAFVADWVVSDFGRSAAAKAEASAHRLEAEAARRQLLDELELSARTAHAEAVEARARVAIAESAVASARASHDIVEARWKAGLLPVIELLDARRSLSEAAVRAVDSRARAQAATARIQHVAGDTP